MESEQKVEVETGTKAYDRAWLNLDRLRSLIRWMDNLLEDSKGYDADATRGGLQLMEEWLGGIMQDVEKIQRAEPNLLERVEHSKHMIEIGALLPLGALKIIDELDDEINRFLLGDLGRLKRLQRELRELGETIYKRYPGKKRASAEPQIQTEARGSDPEGSQHAEG